MLVLTLAGSDAALTWVMAALDMPYEQPVLLGPVGDNAVFGLRRAGIVARLSLRDERDRVDRELIASQWLLAHGLPVTRAVDGIDQPVEHDNLVVTFWHEIPGIHEGSTTDIGEFLRHLHEVPTETAPSVLRDIDPFARIRERIDAATGLSGDERHVLYELLVSLRHQYSTLSDSVDQVVVHGDPHRKNIVRDRSGMVTALDLDRLGIGPAELDLAVPAVYRELEWYGETDYSDFVHAYGRDVRTWDSYPLLSLMRRLRMTCWLAGRTGSEPELIPEARLRVASLRDSDVTLHWSPGV